MAAAELLATRSVMGMRKILLLGPAGQVGWELQRSLQPLGQVIALGREADGLCGDLAQPEALAASVRQIRPHVIVNAAAYTAVDKAESEPALAHATNAAGPAALAREAEASGAWLVHYSTDYVFDGSGDEPRDEDSPTGPLNVYGRTKLEGEQAIRASGCRHLIFRTSWVHGARGGNFAKTMLRLAAEREELRVVNDQFGAPTGAELIADVTAQILHPGPADGLAGTYHLVASGVTTWHGYARLVLEHAAARGLALKADASKVIAVSSAAFPSAARRPHNSRLSTARLSSCFGIALPPWQTGVQRVIDEVLATGTDGHR
jgi:dTDP-4-dehydrorhamnose reductase